MRASFVQHLFLAFKGSSRAEIGTKSEVECVALQLACNVPGLVESDASYKLRDGEQSSNPQRISITTCVKHICQERPDSTEVGNFNFNPDADQDNAI